MTLCYAFPYLSIEAVSNTVQAHYVGVFSGYKFGSVGLSLIVFKFDNGILKEHTLLSLFCIMSL